MHTLCFFAMNDLVGAKKAIQMNSIEDPHFDGSREMELCQAMLQNIEDANRDGFNVAVSQFNSITPLGRSQTSLIVKIKETYMPEEEMGGQKVETQDVDFTGGTDAPASAAGADAPPANVEDDNDFCW